MKLCLLLPTRLSSAYREGLARQSYESLSMMLVPEVDTPLVLYVVYHGDDSLVAVLKYMRHEDIRIVSLRCPDTIGGSDQSICWGVEYLLNELAGLTHFILLSDDMVYNPNWFVETKALVGRHPDAKAWSTYRSAHTRHHRTISVDGDDHLVTSLAGNGTCWSFDEWKAWGIKSSDGRAWPVPTGGDTIDLHHPWARPGERWATSKSFMQHIGTVGVHCHAGTPELALDFVGEA